MKQSSLYFLILIFFCCNLNTFASSSKPEKKPRKKSYFKDTSTVYFLNLKVSEKMFYQTVDPIKVRQKYTKSETYIGGARSTFNGRYDGFFFGGQYNTTDDKKLFGEIGFVSNRLLRPTYSPARMPDFLYVTIAFNIPDKVFGLHLGAKQPLIRKEKSYNQYDLLYIGAEAKFYNNGDFTRRSITPTVSISPPGKLFNNFMLTYGYDFFVNGKEIPDVNKTHILSLHYIFPNF